MDVEIRHVDNIKGKGLFAKRDFSAGTVIFEEDPLVCVQCSWNAAYGYKACDHCLRPLESAQENARRLSGNPDLVLPYPDHCSTNINPSIFCSLCDVSYCSVKCQITAYNQYHRILCLRKKGSLLDHPLFQLNEMWKRIHHPPDTGTIMLIPRILATIQQSPNTEQMQNQFLQFCHRSINKESKLVHKFLGEEFVDQVAELHNLLMRAMNSDGIAQFLTREGFQSLIALIGTNGQGVGTSAVTHWITRISELPLPKDEKLKLDQFIETLLKDINNHSGTFLNNEGVALFSLQSACNHSCVPNAEPFYLDDNSRLSLVALSDIKTGDEICISYLDECTLKRSQCSRNKELSENYLFKCKCPKCEEQADDPNITSDEEEMEEIRQ